MASDRYLLHLRLRVGLKYCSENVLNLQRDQHHNLNHNIEPIL